MPYYADVELADGDWKPQVGKAVLLFKNHGFMQSTQTVNLNEMSSTAAAIGKMQGLVPQYPLKPGQFFKSHFQAYIKDVKDFKSIQFMWQNIGETSNAEKGTTPVIYLKKITLQPQFQTLGIKGEYCYKGPISSGVKVALTKNDC